MGVSVNDIVLVRNVNATGADAAAATETTLAALNTKVPASPSTSGKQDTGNTSLASMLSLLAPPPTAARGEVAGSVTAAQMPSVAGTRATITPRSNNAGNVYMGSSSAVTRPDGVTDTTTGYEMAPGYPRTYALVANLNELWRICDNAGDAVTYEVW